MINKKFISLILFVIVFQSGCEDEVTPPPVIQTYGSLSGIVIDTVKGAGYEGAIVMSLINHVADTTDEAGEFFLDSLLTGIDSILVLSNIHDSLITVIDINEGQNEFAFTPKRLPCFDDIPAEDTTRVYIKPTADRVLELNPAYVFARFVTSVTDSLEVLEIAAKYDLKPDLYGLSFGLNGLGWTGFFTSTVGLRAEYYFTPYGKDNFCNFGTDSLVDDSFGVFGSGEFFEGTVMISFVNGTPEATALNLIESYGLLFLRRSSALQGDDLTYSTIITKRSKKNVLDLGFDLMDEELISFIIL